MFLRKKWSNVYARKGGHWEKNCLSGEWNIPSHYVLPVLTISKLNEATGNISRSHIRSWRHCTTARVAGIRTQKYPTLGVMFGNTIPNLTSCIHTKNPERNEKYVDPKGFREPRPRYTKKKEERSDSLVGRKGRRGDLVFATSKLQSKGCVSIVRRLDSPKAR